MPTPNNTGTGAASSAATEVKKTASDLAEHARDAAGEAVDSASSAAKSQAREAKSSVADEMSGVASALRTAAEEMRKGSPQERTFGQIAEGLADASDAVRDKDLGTMVDDVTRFARNNPLVFLGGAALVGFAATRFAKASAARPTSQPASPATGYPVATAGAAAPAPTAPSTSRQGDFT